MDGRDVGAALGRRARLRDSGVHETLLSDGPRFARLHIDNRTLSWPGDLDCAPEFLYAESWPDDLDPPGGWPR